MFSFLKGRLFLVRFIMLCTMLALVAIGIVAIYATGNPAEGDPGAFASSWKRQIIYFMGGMAALIAINTVSYRKLGPISYWIYGLILVILAMLLVAKKLYYAFGIEIPFFPVRNGTFRWIKPLPGLLDTQIQPSEFCKIAYILALAWYLRYRSNYRKLKGLIGPFLLTLLAMALILLEPDLGTVMLMMPILFAMLYVAGAKTKHLLIILLLAILVSPLLWHFMKPYQRTRIASVLLQNEWIMKKVSESPALATILAGSPQDLENWDKNKGYHLIHSKFAIASGGWKGYGFRKGPYIKYNSLPERRNDFIFAIIAHQWGLIGCLVLLALYALIIICGIEIAWQNTDPFARLITVGILAMFAVEVIVNVSMTLGLMPITGLTLPLVSYGGSSLVVSLIAIGLLNNVGRSRPFSVAKKAFEY